MKNIQPHEPIPPHLIVRLGRTKKPRPKFLKGPVPMWWIEIANRECGQHALAIGLLLFWRFGIGIHPKPITATERMLVGVDERKATIRAIQSLVKARLVRTEMRGRRALPKLDIKSRKPSKA